MHSFAGSWKTNCGLNDAGLPGGCGMCTDSHACSRVTVDITKAGEGHRDRRSASGAALPSLRSDGNTPHAVTIYINSERATEMCIDGLGMDPLLPWIPRLLLALPSQARPPTAAHCGRIDFPDSGARCCNTCNRTYCRPGIILA